MRSPVVLWVIDGFRPAVRLGGPIEASTQTTAALRRAGARVRVLTTDYAGPRGRCDEPRDRWLKREGIAVRYCSSVGFRDVSPAFLRALPRAVRNCDVVHIVGVFCFVTVAAAAVARAMGKPYVVTTAGALEPWSLRHRPLRKRAAGPVARLLVDGAALIHAKSEKERRALAEFGVTRPIAIVPNGVDVLAAEGTSRAARLWRQRLGVSDAQSMLVMLGRIHPVKGCDLAIETLQHLRRAGHDVVLAIAGPDNDGLRRTLESRARELGVEGYIRWLDFVSGRDKFQLLAEADLLLLPSRQENFGNVVVEALAVGTPVIASQHTPWQELEEQRCGRWVPLSAADFAHAAAELLADEERRAAMGERGRRLVAEKYTWDSVARQLLQAYSSVASPRRKHQP